MDLEKQPRKPVAPTVKPVAPAAPGTLRASDADRDRIADILKEALAEGRLDAEEHGERLDSVYRAKTIGELEPLVSDLPVAGGAAPHPGAQGAVGSAYTPGPDAGPAESLVAVFSSNVRKGRWRVAARTNAFSLFGNIEIDLTEALFTQRQTVINATSVFGNVEVRVPENISLRGNGTGIFGNFEVRTLEATDPDAPVVIVNGTAVFGNIEAKPKRGKFIRDLHDRLSDRFGDRLGDRLADRLGDRLRKRLDL